MQIAHIGDGSNWNKKNRPTWSAEKRPTARMAALGLPVPAAFVLPISLRARDYAEQRSRAMQDSDGRE